jgi:hypothetical protein
LDFPLAQAITIRVTIQTIITALVIIILVIIIGRTTTVLGIITPIGTGIITIAGTIGID